MPPDILAPGAPGIAPRWTSSAKCGIGTSLSPESRVWFTLSHGIFNEVYYPRVDTACIRDMGLIVTDRSDFFSEEKRDTHTTQTWIESGVPAFRLTNTCKEGNYRLEKEILTDPRRDVVLQHTRFSALKGNRADYSVFVLLSPHIANRGYENTAWIASVEGKQLLFAQRDGFVLALACSVPWLKSSAGFVGSSDGWQDINTNGTLTQCYTRAENGNVALTGEIDLNAAQGEFTLALAFGTTAADAARHALHSLSDGFDVARRDYISGWQAWIKSHASQPELDPALADLNRISAAVLRVHESKFKAGGMIASLSIPWGYSKGDDDLGGYHLVWARDLVQSAGALLSIGAHKDVLRILKFLQTTQRADGHWAQNMWLDGTSYWDGIQMDETALPILLVDLMLRHNALPKSELPNYWPMIRKAAVYLLRNGPISPEDRWEEDPGYTPFTVAAEIAALLAAADHADLNHEPALALYMRETADIWNDSIDRWMYVCDSDWTRRFDVKGYYVRIASADSEEDLPRFQEPVLVRNVRPEESSTLAIHLVSPDALAFVRFGLRAANDPRMVDTVKVIDALLKKDLPEGSLWYRYNGDGYGEHADGTPFNGTGIGRGWPLLGGERAHYELAAGRTDVAKKLMASMAAFAGQGGMLPEQTWDADDIPERELFRGKPSGSAMPLVWAHGEYLKLYRSIHDGRIFDLPPQTVKRYQVEKRTARHLMWRFCHKVRLLPLGKLLRVETLAPATIHWSFDGWKTLTDTPTHDTGIGVHLADLPTDTLPDGTQIDFTFYWPEATRWEGQDFQVTIRSSKPPV